MENDWVCTVCRKQKLLDEPMSVCKTCENGDVYLCEACVNAGQLCQNPQHRHVKTIFSDFEYTPLQNPSQELRLLYVLPAESFGMPLKYNLKTFKLEKSPTGYCALSYVWGDPERNHLLQCNERRLPITASLDEA
jgi:hypothetical protein